MTRRRQTGYQDFGKVLFLDLGTDFSGYVHCMKIHWMFTCYFCRYTILEQKAYWGKKKKKRKDNSFVRCVGPQCAKRVSQGSRSIDSNAADMFLCAHMAHSNHHVSLFPCFPKKHKAETTLLLNDLIQKCMKCNAKSRTKHFVLYSYKCVDKHTEHVFGKRISRGIQCKLGVFHANCIVQK